MVRTWNYTSRALPPLLGRMSTWLKPRRKEDGSYLDHRIRCYSASGCQHSYLVSSGTLKPSTCHAPFPQIPSPWSAHIPAIRRTSIMFGLSLASATKYSLLFSFAVVLTALCGILLQRREQSMDTALEQKKHGLLWQQVKGAMDLISAGHTMRNFLLDQYWLISIPSICDPTGQSYTWTHTRWLGNSAAVSKYESETAPKEERWTSSHGQIADNLGSQQNLAKAFVQTLGSRRCEVWTDVRVLVTVGEVRVFTMRRAEHPCYEAPPAYSE